jgi:ABC-type dipeptide/oligopeptide/nickel transport system permease component
MLRYIFARLVQMLPTILGIYVLAFALMRVLPGDPAQFLEGDRGDEQSMAETRRRLRLDEPLLNQLVGFIADALQGDLGRSYITNQPVTEMLGQAFVPTLQLALTATVIAVTIGVPLGIVSALYRNSIWDALSRLVALIGVSIPVFWLGLQLQVLFGLQLRLIQRISGYGMDERLILPAISASLGMLALLTRITRSTLLEVLSQDYILTAKSKGLSQLQVVRRHALRNALLPIVTVWGTSLAGLLSGTVLIEVIFSWPGMGRLLINSIGARDYPTVQGVVILFALIYAGLNLLIDLLYPLIDPRIRYQ